MTPEQEQEEARLRAEAEAVEWPSGWAEMTAQIRARERACYVVIENGLPVEWVDADDADEARARQTRPGQLWVRVID